MLWEGELEAFCAQPRHLHQLHAQCPGVSDQHCIRDLHRDDVLVNTTGMQAFQNTFSRSYAYGDGGEAFQVLL